ncbi:MAG: hypothetical protein RLY86_262 [Pseudomonadota bacterium]|jgi:hypothetical protein
MTDPDKPRPLFNPDLAGWRMAGQGRFRWVADGILETEGGHGLFWYEAETFADFTLQVDWCSWEDHDNSGIFLRTPPLTEGPGPAIEHGYEVQIDNRGIAPDGSRDSPLHLTGAVYRLAPALAAAFHPIGVWNRYRITAIADDITVILNDRAVSRLTGGTRRRSGHIALQAHHVGSRVQFRDILIQGL